MGKYNKELHKNHKTPLGNKTELEKGIILVYANKDKDGKIPLLCPHKITKDQTFDWRGKKLIDYTGGSLDLFTNLLSNNRTNKMTLDYLAPLDGAALDAVPRPPRQGVALDRILEKQHYEIDDEDTKRLQGIISWKLFDYSVTLIYEDKKYEILRKNNF